MNAKCLYDERTFDQYRFYVVIWSDSECCNADKYYAKCHCSECRYAKCHYRERHYAQVMAPV